MNNWKMMMYCSALAVSIVLLSGCGEETQSTAGTFFDAIDASASEVGEEEISSVASQLEQPEELQTKETDRQSAAEGTDTQLTQEDTDAQSAQGDRLENKNQSTEMSFQAIQSSKLPSKQDQKLQLKNDAATETVAQEVEAVEESSNTNSTYRSTESMKGDEAQAGNTPSSTSSSSAPSSAPNSASSSASSSTSSSAPSSAPSSASSSAASSTPSSTSSSTSSNTSSSAPSSGASSTPSSASSSGSSSGTTKDKNEIYWSEFFDNDDQTTPSNTFWDLSDREATVNIKGFMGEVLSLDKNWFLLIPEPGAECPFDNGDETYWNKIMIVYVDDDVKLRYTSKPLQITGKLDVGIKIDESGYKTMFRLYDATFKEI